MGRKEIIKQKLEAGIPYREIGKGLGITKQRISSIVKSLNISPLSRSLEARKGEEVMKRHETGTPPKEIAGEMGVSVSTIYRTLRKRKNKKGK